MLDERSRKLLIELDYKARNSLLKISKKLHMSKDATINKLKKLEDEKYIRGYYSVINYALLGYTTYRLYVQLSGITKKIEEEIKIVLGEFKSVRFISFLSGEHDIIITFQVKFPYELEDAYRTFCGKFAKRILKKELACVTEQKHYMQPILKEKEKNVEFITRTSSNIISLSLIEEKLIKLLALNARCSFVNLSKKLNKKPNTILYSLRGLEKKGIILGYRPRLDFNKLNLSHYLVSIQLKTNDFKEIKKFEKALSTLLGIIYVSRGISFYDFEIELVLKDTNQLRNELSFLTETFSEEIAKINSELILSTHVINYCPF